MSSAMTTSTHTTADLALATFLSMNGRSFRMIRGDRQDKVLFIFESVTEDEVADLARLTRSYQGGMARVEPQRFMREVGSVRGQMYDFLDGKRDS